MEDVRKKIGARMRAHADALGWGPAEIAQRLGELDPRSNVEPNSVGRWWTGSRLPRDKTMDLYADCLGVDVGVFYAETIEAPLDEASIGFSMDDWRALRPEERVGIRRQIRSWLESRRRRGEEPPAVPTTEE